MEVQVLSRAPSLDTLNDVILQFAAVAELADALASGASEIYLVEVQVLSAAPRIFSKKKTPLLWGLKV